MNPPDSRLLDAIERGDADELAVLLDAQTFTPSTLERAFKEAGRHGDVSVLEALWSGTSPRRQRYGEAALRAASSQGHEDATRFLLNHGVSPRAKVPVGAPATAVVDTDQTRAVQTGRGGGCAVLLITLMLNVLGIGPR